MAAFDKSVPVANGDLLVFGAEDVMSRKYLLASFHGDTNGLATLPVLAAVHTLAKSMPDHALLFGLDANTYSIGSARNQVRHLAISPPSAHISIICPYLPLASAFSRLLFT